MNDPVLSLKDAMVRYGTTTTVAGVSFELFLAETLGLVGESGCGKSSVARALAGLTPLSSGRLFIDGHDVLPKRRPGKPHARDKVQLLFQDPAASLSPRMTVSTLLAEPLKIRRDFSLANWQALLELGSGIGLGPQLLHRYPHQLSGGQARRVALLRALAAKPQIIIADEPTAGLDISVQGELLNLLRSLQAKLGLSYLLISHNLNVIGRVSDRVAVMYLGQIIETGPTQTIFRAPAHPYTEALLSSNLTVRADRRRERIVLKGELPSPSNPPSGCRFHPRCPVARPVCAKVSPELVRKPDGRAVACIFPVNETAVPHAIAG